MTHTPIDITCEFVTLQKKIRYLRVTFMRDYDSKPERWAQAKL